ncbi:cytochrome-c peroxidase [Mesorhizobium sp. NBSH29]|uniref:cytochrome-c peroxidase n=1 Tax=Mesorhizobium sp. NBSH29 TaxID=2654249 RepID=UPI00215639B4|nr:cytochrome c peroxidase [Mesorhizobium sp. NBSH29]
MLLGLVLAGCAPQEFSETEQKVISSLSLASLPPLPADTSNHVADDPDAAALGATLFFDQRLSGNGTVSCSTCHQIDNQFQDSVALGRGVGTTNRRTMPLAGAAWSPWLFWDGRRDSLWSQALVPLENPVEHGGTRAGYALFIARNFANRYTSVFGPLPDLSGVPEHASPLGNPGQRDAWRAMSPRQQQAVNSVFANIGKMIAAFEREIVPTETRFDRFAAALEAGAKPSGDAALSAEEKLGLKLFIGKAQCATCHNGPRFTDDHFHNTGVAAVAGLPEDLGRETGVSEVLADPFNCTGPFSDAGPDDCGELRFAVTSGAELRRAYKTPSLRGAATRAPYMHAGQIKALEQVIDHYADAPVSSDGVSDLNPLTLSLREREALAAFLKALN